MPTESRLESVVMHLESRADHRNLIRLAERWSEEGDLPARIKVAEARAFLHLRLMDRAWIRLQDVVEGDEPGVESLRLAARLFILRGWPNKARGLLERALELAPEDEELNELWDGLSEPPTQPDTEREESDDPVVSLRQAEAHMAAGAFLKARVILERLRRQDSEQQRVSDLLWALDGDFSAGEVSLSALAERLGPGLAELADLPEEPEHTESVPNDALAFPIERDEDDTGNFPSLFRNATESGPAPLGEDEEEDEGDETTQASSLASIADLSDLSEDESEATQAGQQDDTQILRVIRKDGAEAMQPIASGIHTNVSDESTFDLSSFRLEMGMTPPTSDYDARLEEEDEDLIVLTHTERDATDEVSTGLPSIDLDPTSEAGRVPSELLAVRAPPPTATPAPTPDERSAPPPPRRRLGLSPTSWWLLAISALGTMFVLLLLMLIGLQLVALLR